MKIKNCLHWSVVSCALAASRLQAAPETALFSDLSFEAALKQAGEQKRIVFVDFFTTWCGPCKQLDRTTWQDPAVVALIHEKAVPLRIDAEKETALAARYKIDAYPTLLLLKADGSELDRLVGYRDAAKFIAEFNDALAGKTALMRAQNAVTAADADSGSRVQARYELAQALAHEGDHAKALIEYLWLLDEGMKREPGFAGVRNSFLLSSIATLGASYPPALAALTERRDAAGALIEKETGDASAAADFASLNRVLKQEPLTLELFNRLPANSPTRQHLGLFVFDGLLAARRYAEALAAQPGEQFIMRFDQLNQSQKANPARLNPEALKHIQAIQIENAAKELEALAGADKLEEARQLLQRVRSLDNSEATRATLRQHLERAGQGKLLEPA